MRVLAAMVIRRALGGAPAARGGQNARASVVCRALCGAWSWRRLVGNGGMLGGAELLGGGRGGGTGKAGAMRGKLAGLAAIIATCGILAAGGISLAACGGSSGSSPASSSAPRAGAGVPEHIVPETAGFIIRPHACGKTASWYVANAPSNGIRYPFTTFWIDATFVSASGAVLGTNSYGGDATLTPGEHQIEGSSEGMQPPAGTVKCQAQVDISLAQNGNEIDQAQQIGPFTVTSKGAS
jgi:hypothetical protein